MPVDAWEHLQYPGSAVDAETPFEVRNPVTSLPSDAELLKLFLLGREDWELAQEYDVTIAAVNKRRIALNMRKKPIAHAVNELIPWEVKTARRGPSHHSNSRFQGLKVYLRKRLGDQGLSARQAADADRFERRVRRDGVVLDYDPGSDQGFHFRRRRAEDGRRVLAWPPDVELPSGAELQALDLPDEEA
jgi:hypothetical protein